MDEYIKKISEEIDFSPMKHIKTDMYLNDFEINTLRHYNINYENCINTEELICKIEYAIEEYDDYELEEISKSISERNYYMNTKK